MKRGFEENVPKVRPRVRLGRALDPQLEEAAQLEVPSLGPTPAEAVPSKSPAEDAATNDVPTDNAATDDAATALPIAIAPRARVLPRAAPPPEAPAAVAQRREERPRAALATDEPRAIPASPRSPGARKPGGATQVAALARELTAELNQAAEANGRLKADLDAAVSALRGAAEEAREQASERERLLAELSRREVREAELAAELELVQAERDGALSQASRNGRELREARARAEEKTAEAARATAEAQAAREATERLVLDLGARVQERDALRAELQRARAERDELSEALLAARAEADDASESRNALEEIHRALNEARTRVAKIR